MFEESQIFGFHVNTINNSFVRFSNGASEESLDPFIQINTKLKDLEREL
jgi:hypothetical protein